VALDAMWLEAAGRLHPVGLHFPLALGATAALVEAFAWIRRRPAPSPSAFTLLWLAALSAPLVSASGWFLAASEGDDGSTLNWHRWTGIASAIGLLGAAIMATALRRRSRAAALEHVPGGAELQVPAALKQTRIYRCSLICVAALLGYCGHLGGEMKWGEGFTTNKLFAAMRATLGAPGDATPSDRGTGSAPRSAEEAGSPEAPALARPNSDAISPSAQATGSDSDRVRFDPRIQAIFAERCSECHLGGRKKGKLSLTSRELIVRSNADGLMIVKAGTPDESELMRRVRLPESDDSAMPPEGPRLTGAELALIQRWIDGGAP